MEGGTEQSHWLDVVWLILVIVAAAAFVFSASEQIESELQPGQQTPFNLPDILLLGRLIAVELMLFFVGCSALLVYLFAPAAGIDLLPDSRPGSAGMTPDGRPQSPWSLWDVAKASAAAFLGSQVVLVVIMLVLSLDETSPELVIINGFLVHAGMLILPVMFVRRRGGSLRQMGFTARRLVLNIAHGVGVYLATLPVFFTTAAVSAIVASRLNLSPQHPIVSILQEASDTWFVVAIVLLVTLVGPLTEEVLFRGFLYPAMRRRMSVAQAVFLNGFLFSLVHFSITGMLPYIVLGAALSLLFERTRSLVSCTIFHVLHNTLAVIAMFEIM